jgi:hypothetical protein
MSAQPAHGGDRAGDRWLVAAVGLCAAGPVIASTLRALIDGWVPAGDQANIATRAHDVFTSHTPLVGLHSDVSAVTHHTVYSLGPMLFWLLAPAARVASPGSLAFTMGLVNTAAIVGVIALARRRGGRALMLVTALAIVLMARSLAPEVLHDVWNPSAGLFPFTLLIFLCWSLACGEYRLLPLTVLVASFVAQCQLAFVPPALAALLVALVGLGLWLMSARAELGADGWRRVRRWALGAVLVAVACWTPPAIDQISGRPGNLTAIVRTARANTSTLGAAAGWHAVVLAVGVRPWWLTNPADAFNRKREVRANPSTLASVSTVLALCALLIIAVVGILGRRPDLWTAALIALGLCAGLAAVAASTPDTRLLSATLGYTMWSGSPIGMFVWVVLAWTSMLLLAGRVRMRATRVSSATAFAVAVAALACAAIAVGLGERRDEHLSEYRPLGAMLARLDRAIPSGRTVQLIGILGNETFRFKMAARYALVEHGVRPISPGTDTRVGSWYELDHRRYDCTVYIKDGAGPPSGPAALLAAVRYAQTHPVSAWVAPASCAAGRPTTSFAAATASSVTAPGYATTWVSYPRLLRQVRSGPLIRAIINPARADVEIKFRNLQEWHAFYPRGAQATLQRLLHARHVRVLFVPRHPGRASQSATEHRRLPARHHLRYIAALIVGLLVLLAVAALVYRRRSRRAAARP